MSRFLLALGLFFFFLALYVLSSPGRIDIIDGQHRFEVAYNIVELGRPIVRDKALKISTLKGKDKEFYSFYGWPGSFFGAPMIWVAGKLDDPIEERRRFAFSMVSPIFGALTLSVFFLFLIDLGIKARSALGWTFVNGFSTMLWPTATSSFDNAQHAFFVLVAVWLIHRAVWLNRILPAFGAGGAMGILIGYQEYYFLLSLILCVGFFKIPSDFTWGSFLVWEKWKQWLLSEWGRKDTIRKLLAYQLMVFVGIGIFFWFNYSRFGDVFRTGRRDLPFHPALLGNPLIGIPGLTISIGKGILWYSPTVVLSFFGIVPLFRRWPAIGAVIMLATLGMTGFYSCFSFYGGDWCWGPRYLVCVLPAFMLASAFAQQPFWRYGRIPLVAVAIFIQLLAVSVDHQRFFFARGLPAFFWAYQPETYFQESALLDRFREVRSLVKAPPATVVEFTPNPYPGMTTYCIFGLPRNLTPSEGLDRYMVFHVPRPWPLWVPLLPAQKQFIDTTRGVSVFLLTFLLGLVLIRGGLKKSEDSQQS